MFFFFFFEQKKQKLYKALVLHQKSLFSYQKALFSYENFLKIGHPPAPIAPGARATPFEAEIADFTWENGVFERFYIGKRCF
jgi:hypothetical protein